MKYNTPLLIKSINGMMLAGIGDFIAQKAQKQQKNISVESKQFIDPQRLIAFSVFGGSLGMFNHYWIDAVGKRFPIIKFSNTLKKSAIQAFIYVPFVYMPLYFYLVGLIRGLSFKQINGIYQNTFQELFIQFNSFWIPVNFFMFQFVPLKHVVIVSQYFGLIWNSLIAYYGNKNFIKQ